MKALISTVEPRADGYRVAQVVEDGDTFTVADAFFWNTCPDNIVADQYWYNPNTQEFNEMPSPPPLVAAGNQPNSSGTQPL